MMKTDENFLKSVRSTFDNKQIDHAIFYLLQKTLFTMYRFVSLSNGERTDSKIFSS